MFNEYNPLKKAIFQTICFYDLFDYPLMPDEVWRILDAKVGLEEVKKALQNKLAGLEEQAGYYFLAGRSEIISTREQRKVYAERKFRRAIRVARLFKLIPWIRLIAIGNQIGADNLSDQGDIDFFIITDPKRVWITRFFAAGLMQALRLRPTAGARRDRVCLSFFVSAGRQDISRFRLGPDYLDDPYYTHWFANLSPIYERGDAWQEFIGHNSWIHSHLPNWQAGDLEPGRSAGAGFSCFYHDVVDMLVGGAEPIFKKWQLKIMPDDLHRQMNNDACVVVNDHVLKLHSNDRREEIRKKYKSSQSSASAL